MLRWVGGIALGAFATAVSGCYAGGGGACGDVAPHCSGNTVVTTSYVTSDDCITQTYETDCTEMGMLCRDGGCWRPPPKNPCPGGNGECRGELAFRCDAGGLPDEGEDCVAQGLSCIEFSRGGHVQAMCALSSTPCASITTALFPECHGNDVVHCYDGFPVFSSTCEGENIACVDYDANSSYGEGARCTYSVPCPADGGTLCHDDAVYGCDGGDSTVELLACFDGSCVERSGRSLCAAATPPPAMRFVPLPGGAFRAGPSEPEVVLAAYELLEREVTVSEYAACVAEGACPPVDAECVAIDRSRRNLQADLPVTCVDLPRAQAFCATLGARVPAAVEWKYALSNALGDYQLPCAPESAPCERTSVLYPSGEACGSATVACASRSDVTTQGVCDLLGSVVEIVEHEAGSGVPARCGAGSLGCDTIRLDNLGPHQIGELQPLSYKGFRCAR